MISTIPFTTYEEALARLDYMTQAKRRMCEMLDGLIAPAQSSLFVKVKDRDHAVACIREALDELFYDESQNAQQIKEAYEQADSREALHEWSTL